MLSDTEIKQFLQKVLKTLRKCYFSSSARLRQTGRVIWEKFKLARKQAVVLLKQSGRFIKKLFQNVHKPKLPVGDPLPAVQKPAINILRIALDHILWIWAILIAVGIIIFKLTSGGLPGMASRIVFTSWWETELAPDTLQNLITKFEEKNPDISITLNTVKHDEIRELLQNKGKDAGDIISVDSFWLPDLEDLSLLTPLNTATGESGRYALPVISVNNPLFYNIKLLQEAGFDRPPKTQAEFLAYAQKINKPAEGISGAALALSAGDSESVSREILSWIFNAAGVPVENSEGVSYADYHFTSKQAVPVFEFLNQLKGSLYLDPYTLSPQQKIDAFKAGKIGMIIAPASELRNLSEADFSVTTIPVLPAFMGKSVFSLSSWYVGVNAETTKQEAAETFIRYLRDNSGAIAAAAYAIPGNGRRNPEMAKASANYIKAFDMYDAGEMVRNRPPITAEFNTAVRSAVGRMFAGSLTPAEAAAAVQAAWEGALK
jgi:ABC-type glycerol-3-phosphate transport system substrate-binding protein